MTDMKSLVAILLCLPLVTQAATKYVSTTGSNSTGDGTIGNPWRTITFGQGNCNPGDTLEIRGGTYVESVVSTANGTAGSPIIVQNFSAENVVIQPTASTTGWDMNASHIYWRTNGGGTFGINGTNIVSGGWSNIRMDGPSNVLEGIFSVACPIGMGVLVIANDSQIKKSTFGWNGWNYSGGSAPHGIYLSESSGSGNNVLIENCHSFSNHFHGDQSCGIQMYAEGDDTTNIILRNNRCHNNNVGILVSHCSDSAMYNNLCYNNNNSNWQIYYGATSTLIANNVAYMTSAGVSGHYGFHFGNGIGTGNRAINNIAYGPNWIGIRNDGGTTFTNNLIDGAVNTDFFNAAGSGNLYNGDFNPQFTDADNGDFRIGASSAARNAGFNLSEFTTSFYGVTRPQESIYEIGPDERSAGGQLPTVNITRPDPGIAYETGPTPLSFTFTRVGSTAGSLNIIFTISGSAVNGTDYTTITSPATITDGNSTITKTVTPVDDPTDDDNETVTLTISADAAYTIGSPSVATITIEDNDSPPPAPITATNQPAPGNVIAVPIAFFNDLTNRLWQQEDHLVKLRAESSFNSAQIQLARRQLTNTNAQIVALSNQLTRLTLIAKP
jgi:hypothetical protein